MFAGRFMLPGAFMFAGDVFVFIGGGGGVTVLALFVFAGGLFTGAGPLFAFSPPQPKVNKASSDNRTKDSTFFITFS